MNSPHDFDRASHNPFATRYIRPGALAYLFPAETSLPTLINKLRSNHWRGEIVGPHGVGKSTLLAALLPEIAAQGREVIAVTLHARERRLPADMPGWKWWNQQSVIVIDGYEQLSIWSRMVLFWQIWLRGAGLLITTHKSFGLPTLIELIPQAATAIAVVRALGVSEQQIDDVCIQQTLQATHGDVREMLFQLYDRYELWLREQ
jgi:hypothetical protein